MILLNNVPIKTVPVSKDRFEYGNEIIWQNGKFLELFIIYKLTKQLKKENTLYNDLLIIDGLTFKNSILLFIMCFIIKKTDIRVYSTTPLPERLPHTTIHLELLGEADESF